MSCQKPLCRIGTCTCPPKSIVRQNAEQNANYAPYCLKCTSFDRMKKIEAFYWRCPCGAEHDERE
jgi:hypothetical protein